AAWGNGLSQSFGIVVVWRQARRFYTFSFPVRSAIRLLAAGVAMAALAFYIGHEIPGVPGLIVAILCGAPTYLILVKLFRGLDSSDRLRLAPVGERLPVAIRRAYLAIVTFVTPAAE
ncbi:MAG: polysaccharide biosynthesis C-terminal domain-containing protein, partial [Acidobacteriaceae bacterium]